MSRLVSMMAVAWCLGACTGVDSQTDGSDLAGIYYLVKVDGSAIPAEVSHDGVALRVRAGTFIIGADGTCFSRTRFVPPGGEETVREVSATYRAEGSRLIMQWEGAGVTEGEVTGDTFVMDNHGMIFEYTRGE